MCQVDDSQCFRENAIDFFPAYGIARGCSIRRDSRSQIFQHSRALGLQPLQQHVQDIDAGADLMVLRRIHEHSSLERRIPNRSRIFAMVRGCLEIPVHGYEEPFSWGLWLSLSESSFREWVRTFYAQQRSDVRPFFGWLNTRLHGYPETLNRAH